ncbi:MAG: hypothetical protein JWM94_687 [Sphingomonas bacterium]|nr:hypothetical protein [Sphingomonas bacterium]
MNPRRRTVAEATAGRRGVSRIAKGYPRAPAYGCAVLVLMLPFTPFGKNPPPTTAALDR